MAGGSGYDIGVGISGPASASGAGGGNVFNAAPLFGSLFGQYGSSSGDNGAATSATSAASGKGAVPISGGNASLPASTGSGQLQAYLPFILIGGAALILIFGLVEIFKVTRK